MKSNFEYSNDNKRYHTWNYHLREKFGSKVFKVSLNGGFTCPNKDGTKGVGGCTYCSSSGSGDFAGCVEKSIKEQFDDVRASLHKKWKDAKYIAYFQANTNTYASADILREKFESVLCCDNVVGLSIATRADCLEDDVLKYLSELNKRTYLIVELGLQTIFDETGKRINRCHSYEEFLQGYQKLKERNINTAVDTCGNVPWEHFVEVLPITDLFLYDIKHIDPDVHKKLTGADNCRILENLQRLSEAGGTIEIRMPLVPQINDDEKTLCGIGAFLQKLNITRMKVLPYHAMARSKYAALGMRDTMPNVPEPTEEAVQKAVERLRHYGIPAVSGRE